MNRDTSKPRIHSATTYKLYIFSCVLTASGVVLMFKFPEMHGLEAGIDPLSYTVYGMSIKIWKIVHIVSSALFIVFTALHMYFNREWIRNVGAKRLNLNMVAGLSIGIVIIALGIFAPFAISN
jgi:uncharacterized membrane protein YidH (DUF202 family)